MCLNLGFFHFMNSPHTHIHTHSHTYTGLFIHPGTPCIPCLFVHRRHTGSHTFKCVPSGRVGTTVLVTLTEPSVPTPGRTQLPPRPGRARGYLPGAPDGTLPRSALICSTRHYIFHLLPNLYAKTIGVSNEFMHYQSQSHSQISSSSQVATAQK